MNGSITELEAETERFITSVENQDRDKQVKALKKVANIYSERRVAERVDVKGTSLTLNSAHLSIEDRENLEAFLSSAAEANLVRAGFLNNAEIQINYPEKVGVEELKEQANTLLKKEKKVSNRFSGISDQITDSNVDGTPLVADIDSEVQSVPKGATITVTATIANAGTATLRSLKITHSGADQISPKSVSIDSLKGRQKERVEYQVSFSSAGRATLETKVSSSSKSDTRQATVVVKNKTDLLEEVSTVLSQLQKEIENNSTNQKPYPSLQQKVDTVIQMITRANEQAMNGQSKRANKVIESAMSTMESFQKGLSGYQNEGQSQFPPLEYNTYISLGETAINQLEKSVQASV